MSHFIQAYEAADVCQLTEIALLERSAGSPSARVIYEALGAERCYGGCSGAGDEMTFTNEQLKTALERIPAGEATDMEREFLATCIAADGPITVTFY
jgi:hypothetical protein